MYPVQSTMLFEYATEDFDPSRGRACKQILGKKGSEVVSEFLARREGMIGSAFSVPQSERREIIAMGLAIGERHFTESYPSEFSDGTITPHWIAIWSNTQELFDRALYQIQPDGTLHYVVLSDRQRDIDYVDDLEQLDRVRALPIVRLFVSQQQDILQRVTQLPGELSDTKHIIPRLEAMQMGIWYAVYSRRQGQFVRLLQKSGPTWIEIDLNDYQSELEIVE